MISYLIIPLDFSSVSFCHYHIDEKQKGLMPIETLKEAIRYGMKQNLQIQFIYPNNELPDEYAEMIESIDHIKVKPIVNNKSADIIVEIGWANFDSIHDGSQVIIRSGKDAFFENYAKILSLINRSVKVNLTLTDIDKFNATDFNQYESILDFLIEKFQEVILRGEMPQLNILTDRLILTNMRNCGAGSNAITLMPNGKFYICPAFYYDSPSDSVGTLAEGLKIPNCYLYKLSHSPICSHCDAFHCHRCVWLNKKLTLEVNTPSHEQCVISHIERNATRKLSEWIKSNVPNIRGVVEISEINYLDPITKHREWQ